MLPVYRGRGKQYGYGIGSIIKGVTKKTIPLLEPIGKNILNTLKQDGINEGIGAFTDIVKHGENVKQVVGDRGLQTIKKISRNLLSGLDKSIQGRTIKKRSSKKKTIKSNGGRKKFHLKKIKRRSKVNKRSLDIFD